MFYEAVVHELIKINTLSTLITALHQNKFDRYHVPYTTVNGIDVYFVSDTHIDDNTFGEVAILIKENEKWVQIESWTGKAITEQGIIDTINDPPIKCITNLIVNEPNISDYATFTCGCCGDSFYGNVRQQLTYGQDEGYGYCEECVDTFNF